MTVELFPCKCWDCPECGTENIVHLVERHIKDLPLEELKQVREYLGLEENDEIDENLTYTRILAQVTCKFCKNSYDAKLAPQ